MLSFTQLLTCIRCVIQQKKMVHTVVDPAPVGVGQPELPLHHGNLARFGPVQSPSPHTMWLIKLSHISMHQRSRGGMIVACQVLLQRQQQRQHQTSRTTFARSLPARGCSHNRQDSSPAPFRRSSHTTASEWHLRSWRLPRRPRSESAFLSVGGCR